MKLQGMSILYILIIVPILIVISLYFASYKELLAKTQNYNMQLSAASKDAISAFEINSVNQNYNNIADNFNTLVDSSINVFKNSLATRLNMTNMGESAINRYFPLGLFTAHSGFYVYSPVNSPVVVKNPYTAQTIFSGDIPGNTQLDFDTKKYTYNANASNRVAQSTPVLFRTKPYKENERTIETTTSKDFLNKKLAYEKVDYSLKTLIPYNAKFKIGSGGGVRDMVVNFTLDNYISVDGLLGNPGEDTVGTINKSGYLLDYDTEIKVERVTKDGNKERVEDVFYKTDDLTKSYKSYDHLYAYDEYIDEYVEKHILNYQNGNAPKNVYFKMTVRESLPYTDIDDRGFDENINEDKYREKREAVIYIHPYTYQVERKKYIQAADVLKEKTGEYAYQLQQADALKYYVKAANFSNFIYMNLSKVSESEFYNEKPMQIKGYKDLFVPYDTKSKEPIFSTKERISHPNSRFNQFKRKVIRNTITYEMINATANYNVFISSSKREFSLPVLREEDWDKILTNISFTAFLNGFKLNTFRTYKNYYVATSTQNEFMVNPETIYFAKVNGFNKGGMSFNEAKKKGIDLYYYNLNSEKVLNELSKPGQDTRMIGAKISDWKYDARFSKQLAKYQFDFKNYADIDTVINGEGYTRKDYYDNTKMNNTKRQILDNNLYAAMAAEKERQYKENKIRDAEIVFFDWLSGKYILDIKGNAFKTTKIVFPKKYSGMRKEITLKMKRRSNGLKGPEFHFTTYKDIVSLPPPTFGEYNKFLEAMRPYNSYDNNGWKFSYAFEIYYKDEEGNDVKVDLSLPGRLDEIKKDTTLRGY